MGFCCGVEIGSPSVAQDGFELSFSSAGIIDMKHCHSVLMTAF